jgi:hypothetical protein
MRASVQVITHTPIHWPSWLRFPQRAWSVSASTPHVPVLSLCRWHQSICFVAYKAHVRALLLYAKHSLVGVYFTCLRCRAMYSHSSSWLVWVHRLVYWTGTFAYMRCEFECAIVFPVLQGSRPISARRGESPHGARAETGTVIKFDYLVVSFCRYFSNF